MVLAEVYDLDKKLQGIQGGGGEEEGVGALLDQVHEGEDEQGVR